MSLALHGAINRWRQQLNNARTPTLLVRATGVRQWWIGVPDDPATVTMEVPAYELFRALAGRRTQEQVRSWAGTPNPRRILLLACHLPFIGPTAISATDGALTPRHEAQRK
jgi:hypothetical protein